MSENGPTADGTVSPSLFKPLKGMKIMLPNVSQVSSDSETARVEVLSLLRDSITVAVSDLYDEGVHHEDLADALHPDNVTGDLGVNAKRASRLLIRRLAEATLTRLLSGERVTITVAESDPKVDGQPDDGDA